MTGTIYIMKVLLCTASFLLLCVAGRLVDPPPAGDGEITTRTPPNGKRNGGER